MQRVLTTLVLLCFAIGPGLNVECLVRCAPKDVAEASTDHCHNPAKEAPQFSASADCVEHQAVPAPAVVVTRSETASASLVVLVDYILPVNANTLSLRVTSTSALITGPPPSLSATPLRI